MTRGQLEAIFENTDSKWEGDNAWQGLSILAKYIDPMETGLIQGADHDVIWSVDVDKVLEAGLNQQDAKELALLNWHIDEDGDNFSCFV